MSAIDPITWIAIVVVCGLATGLVVVLASEIRKELARAESKASPPPK